MVISLFLHSFLFSVYLIIAFFVVVCLLCSLYQFSSVAQSCPTLCNPMNHSIPGLPAHHQLPEFTQTHVHWVGDAIQPSHPLSSPSPPVPNPSQHQGLFHWVNSLHEVAKVLEFQLLASVLPMNTQDWSPLGWTGWISLFSIYFSLTPSQTLYLLSEFSLNPLSHIRYSIQLIFLKENFPECSDPFHQNWLRTGTQVLRLPSLLTYIIPPMFWSHVFSSLFFFFLAYSLILVMHVFEQIF